MPPPNARNRPDWRRFKIRPPPAARPGPPGVAHVAAIPTSQVAAADAAHLAAGCSTLAQLRAALEGFEGLALKQAVTSTVFADGNPEAAVMCIGDSPDQEEDRQGLPFCGSRGKLFDRMLHSIGLDRSTVYITNVVPWRPPANRRLTPDEVAVCMPFLSRHIELVDPQLLILFGGAAASALLAKADHINRLRGRWFEFNSPGLPRPVPALATFHPAFLLATPEAKRDAWRDLLLIQKKLTAGRH